MQVAAGITHGNVVGAITAVHSGRALVRIDVLKLQHKIRRFHLCLWFLCAPSSDGDDGKSALEVFGRCKPSFRRILRPQQRRYKQQCPDDRKCREFLVDRHTCSFYGASVGCASNVSRPSRPDDTRTLFFELTIIPSTSGSCSISAIPDSGPMMNTPVERPSATVALGAMIVTLRHPSLGSPVAGSMM